MGRISFWPSLAVSACLKCSFIPDQLVPTSLFLKISISQSISQSPSRNRVHAEDVWHALGLEKSSLRNWAKLCNTRAPKIQRGRLNLGLVVCQKALVAGVRDGVQALRAAFSPWALRFQVDGQLLFQVTSPLVNIEEVGKQLLNGTFGYFGGTDRGRGSISHSFGLSHSDLGLKALDPNEWQIWSCVQMSSSSPPRKQRSRLPP